MHLFSFIHFFSFLVYIYLLVYILTRNPRSALNRVCAVLFATFSIWSFGMIFIHHPETTRKTARIFENIGVFGWVGFPSFLLWLILIFTGKERIRKARAFLPALFIPTAIFIQRQWTNHLIIDHIRQPYGWAGVWSDSVWSYLYYVYYTVFVGAALWMIVDFRKKTQSAIKKREAEIILIATLVPFIFGSLTDVVFPKLGIYFVPDVAPTLALVWAFGTAYAIAKYKFLTI